jgi:hypothetical protein
MVPVRGFTASSGIRLVSIEPGFRDSGSAEPDRNIGDPVRPVKLSVGRQSPATPTIDVGRRSESGFVIK